MNFLLFFLACSWTLIHQAASFRFTESEKQFISEFRAAHDRCWLTKKIKCSLESKSGKTKIPNTLSTLTTFLESAPKHHQGSVFSLFDRLAPTEMNSAEDIDFDSLSCEHCRPRVSEYCYKCLLPLSIVSGVKRQYQSFITDLNLDNVNDPLFNLVPSTSVPVPESIEKCRLSLVTLSKELQLFENQRGATPNSNTVGELLYLFASFSQKDLWNIRAPIGNLDIWIRQTLRRLANLLRFDEFYPGAPDTLINLIQPTIQHTLDLMYYVESFKVRLRAGSELVKAL